VKVYDEAVIPALQLLSEYEGIIPALEPAHAVAWVASAAKSGEIEHGQTVLITLSGRGDKDVAQVMEALR
jgi:tryptophan synthase beta chain